MRKYTFKRRKRWAIIPVFRKNGKITTRKQKVLMKHYGPKERNAY